MNNLRALALGSSSTLGCIPQHLIDKVGTTPDHPYMEEGHNLEYHFDFEDGTEWHYTLAFDKQGRFIPHGESSVENPEETSPPIREWTKLSTHKCSHCPLEESEHPQCPVARNLDQIVEDSKDSISCTTATVTVNAPERTYSKQDCPTQVGLHSLFGVIMASSGCPHLEWLKPLARFHLPFSGLHETVFRILALQLLTDYFSNEEMKLKDSVLSIKEKYAGVEAVNTDFIKRIRMQCDGDADKNAIVALNVFTQLFEYELRDDFEDLRVYFEL